jgi:hypothetical protein
VQDPVDAVLHLEDEVGLAQRVCRSCVRAKATA